MSTLLSGNSDTTDKRILSVIVSGNLFCDRAFGEIRSRRKSGIAAVTFSAEVGMMSEVPDSEENIHYQCQRCGNCCRWPGEVPVGDKEIAAIAEFLNMPLYDFIAEHTDLRLNRTGLTLKEKPNGECIFLEGQNHCLINEVKPYQCSGFPNRWNFPGWQKVCEAIPVKLT